MMHRRSLLASSAAIAAMTTLAPQLAAAAATERPKRLSLRGHDGILDRYPTLHMESHDDLIAGFRKWTNGALKQAADDRAIEIFKEHGIDPKSDLPMAEALKLIGNDPIIAQSGYAWIDVQRIKYKKYQGYYHRNADRFLAEMEAFDKSGPGSLELNPDMHIPGYCAREIHQQPGGYVGDPFAGHMYHWATIVSADGRNNQDVTHDASAAATPVPADGKVRRILDLGTSIGQYATSLKKRFPDAEVWGIDIGGPMVRYAHMRAVDMGVGVNFAQRLAEDTKFPDNHFDIVASNIMHHEVTAEASKRIFKETQRILRPGGHYFPADVYTSAPPPTSAIGKHFMFWTFRWNREDWWLEWADLDKEKALREAGLTVSRTPPGERRGNNLLATKA